MVRTVIKKKIEKKDGRNRKQAKNVLRGKTATTTPKIVTMVLKICFSTI